MLNLLSEAIKNAGKYDIWSKEEDDDINNCKKNSIFDIFDIFEFLNFYFILIKDNDDGDFLQPVKKRKIKVNIYIYIYLQ